MRDSATSKLGRVTEGCFLFSLTGRADSRIGRDGVESGRVGVVGVEREGESNLEDEEGAGEEKEEEDVDIEVVEEGSTSIKSTWGGEGRRLEGVEGADGVEGDGGAESELDSAIIDELEFLSTLVFLLGPTLLVADCSVC